MPSRKEIEVIEIAFENKYDVGVPDEYDDRLDEKNPYYQD